MFSPGRHLLWYSLSQLPLHWVATSSFCITPLHSWGKTITLKCYVSTCVCQDVCGACCTTRNVWDIEIHPKITRTSPENKNLPKILFENYNWSFVREMGGKLFVVKITKQTIMAFGILFHGNLSIFTLTKSNVTQVHFQNFLSQLVFNIS